MKILSRSKENTDAAMEDINGQIRGLILKGEVESGLQIFERLISPLDKTNQDMENDTKNGAVKNALYSTATGATGAAAAIGATGQEKDTTDIVVANASTFDVLFAALKQYLVNLEELGQSDVAGVKKSISDAMMNIFEQMETRFGMKRTLETYQTMIDTMFIVNRVRDAVHIFDSMPYAIDPSAELIARMLKNLFKRGQLKDAFRVWEHNVARVDITCVNVYLEGLVKHDRVKQAMAVLEGELFTKRILYPTPVTYSIISKGIAASQGADAAEKWMQDKIGKKHKGKSPATCTSVNNVSIKTANNAVLQGLLSKKKSKDIANLKRAKEIFEEMRQSRTADTFTLSIMINGCISFGDVHYAMEISNPILEKLSDEVPSENDLSHRYNTKEGLPDLVPIFRPLLRALAICYSNSRKKISRERVEKESELIFRVLISSTTEPNGYDLLQMFHMYTAYHRFDKIMRLCDEFLLNVPDGGKKWKFNTLFVDLINRVDGKHERMAGIVILYSILRFHKQVPFELERRTLHHIITFTKSLVDYSDGVLTVGIRIIHDTRMHEEQLYTLLEIVQKKSVALDWNTDTVVMILEILARVRPIGDSRLRDSVSKFALSRVRILLSGGRCTEEQIRSVLSSAVAMITHLYPKDTNENQDKPYFLADMRRKNELMEQALQISASQDKLPLEFTMNDIYATMRVHTQPMVATVVKLFSARGQIDDIKKLLSMSSGTDDPQFVLRIFLDELFNLMLDHVALQVVQHISSLHHLDIDMLNMILSMYKKHKRYHDVAHVLKAIRENQGGSLPKFDTRTASLLIEMSLLGKSGPTITSSLQFMTDQDFIGDTRLFNVLLLHSTKHLFSSVSLTEDHGWSSGEAKLDPDDIVGSALRFLTGQDQNLFNEVRTKVFQNVQPDHVTYGVAIKYSAHNGHLDRAYRMLVHALALPDASTFTERMITMLFVPLVKAYALQQHVPAVKKLLGWMSELGVNMSHPQVIKVVSMCESDGDSAPLYEDMYEEIMLEMGLIEGYPL